MTRASAAVRLSVGLAVLNVLTLRAQSTRSSIGREVSVPRHLQDGEEFTIPLPALLAHGLLLFNATWTEQEGGGRPLTKGTGRPLADPSRPLTGNRAFNSRTTIACVPGLGEGTRPIAGQGEGRSVLRRTRTQFRWSSRRA